MSFDLGTKVGAARALAAVQRAYSGTALTPTEEQLAIIRHGASPALVIAGAGAGKTAVMALRVVYQVLIGAVEPDEVLGLTFTRKAANELAGRVAGMLRAASEVPGLDFDRTLAVLARPKVTTYNSFASAIAADHGLMVGMDPDARLIEEGERYQIMHDLLMDRDANTFGDMKTGSIIGSALKLAASLVDNARTVDDLRSYLEEYRDFFDAMPVPDEPPKNKKKPVDIWKNPPGKVRAELAARMEILDLVEDFYAYKAEHRLIEFADQVATARRVLEASPALASEIRSRHSMVLLDEYQDTSVSQASFLAALFGSGHNVIAVGDPNQAIYGWRGASADALDQFRARFSGGESMPVYHLVTAFRNKAEILKAANAVAAPLRQHSALDMRELKAVSGGGSVDIVWSLHRGESYSAIAEDMAAYQARHPEASMAALCRARSAFDYLIPELEKRGIDYIAFGSARATAYPEAMTVRGLLRAVDNPARADGLRRVVALLGIAPADIAELHRLVRGRREDPPESLVDALSRIDQGNFSERGAERLRRVGQWMRELSAARYARLDHVVALAIDLTGLNVEVAARSRSGGAGRAGLDALQRFAARFADQAEGASLGAYLDWLDMVDAHEKGSDDGDLPMAELAEDIPTVSDEELTRPNRVTLMTIHGAKGLEWDYVAVPELNINGLTLAASASSPDHWAAKPGELPTELREDRASLAHWDWRGCVDVDELHASFKKYVADYVEEKNRETLRLGYVAFTRPRDRLLLAGQMYVAPGSVREAAEKSRAALDQGKPPGAMREMSAVVPDYLRPEPMEIAEFLARAEELSDEDDQATVAVYPTDIERGDTEAVRSAAELVRSASPTDLGAEEGPQWLRHLALDAEALLQPAERPGVILEHATANDLVSAAEDAQAFRRRRMRPVPEASGPAARRGQQVHEYIAASFSRARSHELIDVDDGAQVVGVDESDPQIATLIERFEHSEFAGLRPIAIEEPVEVVLAGLPIRGVIDAVFADGDGVRIVDWKTGRRPGKEQLEIRAVQLELYRHAWARLTGRDPATIGASFYFLGEDDPTRRRVDIAAGGKDLAALVNALGVTSAASAD
ncbi:MAG: ATP-dependent DNA helicase [Flaviflexus sp.]|nr:ATP-dependent DNA helicase [Flaviflexus sp.]